MKRSETVGMTSKTWLCIPLLILVACSSAVVREAKQAEKEGRLINNEMMMQLYPQTYRPGRPQYLERDFEAGADFICAEIKLKTKQDPCSDPQINWR